MADARSAEKLFARALKEGRLAPVYYLYGEDDFRKDEYLRQIVEHAVEPATRDFNLEVRRGAELDAATLSSLLGTPPLMAARRAVVLRDVTSLKRDARDALARYLAAPAPDVVLVLMSPAGAKADKAIEKEAAAWECKPLEGDRVPRWIMHHAREALKVEVSPPAAARLQAVAGDDLQQLSAELEKLAAFAWQRAPEVGAVIDEGMVESVVGVRRGETMEDLLDRIADRDAPAALALVRHVLAQPKASGVTLVMALGAQTLAIGWALAALADGTSASRLKDSLFGLFRAKSVWMGRSWNDAAAAVIQAATSGRWNAAHVDRALEALLAADIALKNTVVTSEEQTIVTLVLTICAPSDGRKVA